jgi:PAS domain-containing protein
VLWDAEDRLVLCNRKFREFYGEAENLLSPGWRFEQIARALAEEGIYVEAKDRIDEYVRERVGRHLNPGSPFEELTSSGHWLRVREFETADGGIVGIIADVTKEKEHSKALLTAKTQAEAASRAKTEFFGRKPSSWPV